ncbi:hypothetical protein [Novosphingobium sp. G106]|uniref:hypothetical protein n=1 Tax=Novosphingobium sp. G106 TaxID=2849500 RepID=UPI0035C79735
MFLEVGDHRKLASVQRRIANAVDALIGFDLERDEIAPRTGDDDPGSSDLHGQQKLRFAASLGA